MGILEFEVIILKPSNYNKILNQKNLFYFLQWKPFKNDEKWFLFHLKTFLVLKILKFSSRIFDYAEKTH